jgi:type I restriction enzyme S subunit
MAKKANASAMPRLRFPEFRDSPGWKKVPLAAVLSEHGLKSDAQSQVHSVSLVKGVVPQIEHLGRSFAAADTSHYSLVRPDDVVYTRSPLSLFKLGIVKQHRAGQNALVSPLYGVFSPANKYIGTLVEAYFDSPSRNLRFLEPLAQKGAKNTIQLSNDRFLSGEMHLPGDQREQQKVVDCLTSLNDVIAAQSRKVEALKAHKRGLMQQLFPRDGEKVPRLRFPQFAGELSWNTAKISELLRKDSRPVTVSPELSYREIGIRSHGKGIFHKEPVTGATIGGKRVFHVVANALVVNIVFAWEQAVATTSHAENGMIASHRFPMFVARPGKCDVRYVKEFFLTKRGKHLLSVASPGGAGRNKTLGQSEFENLEIALPERVEEQTHIADFLALLDGTIVGESQRLDALSSHKAGLMQQLFPSPERS